MSDGEAVLPFLIQKREVESITPFTRKEMFLAYAGGEDVNKPTPVTRTELFLNYLGDSSASIPEPVTRIEKFIAKVHNESIETPEPVTRVERILAYITDDNINVSDPRTREEIFLIDAANYIKQHGGGGETFTLSYYNYDGSTLLYSETVESGADGAGYHGETPTKPETAQYTYSFIGWNTSPNKSTAESDALKNITDDRSVYAAFSETEKTFTVYFYNGNTLLQTVNNVVYGETATYTGSAPTKTGYLFTGWNPSNTNITSDTNCYAQFEEDELYESISDSWAQIAEACGNGTYSTKYHIGDTKVLDLGAEGQVAMKIVGIDTDDLADGSGKAPLTWISKQLLKTGHRMNPSKQSGTEGTGAIGGWDKSEMKTYLNETIKPLMPAVVLSSIKAVKKYTRIFDTSENSVSNVLTTDDLWIPSRQEILGDYQSSEANGTYYSTAFPDATSRIKNKLNGNASWWWLRSAFTASNFYAINAEGAYNNLTARTSNGIALGFCTGVQTHTVYFYNGDTLLQTVENVPHGGTATYTGAEPISSNPNYVFNGWTPNNTNITSDTSCYAQFVDSRLTETITDSWEEIIAACGDGTYSTKYQVGDTKILDLGSEGQVEMEIVGMNVDDLSDNSGKAPITWISKQLLKTSHDMYSSAYNYYANWASTTMRSYLRDTILPLMPAEVQNGIKEVKKYTHNRTGNSSWATVQSNETVWIPSYKEVGGTASVETDGIVYNSIANDTARAKTKVGDSSVIPWWLRSASTYTDAESYYFCIVGNTGRPTHYGSYCYGALGVALAMCT